MYMMEALREATYKYIEAYERLEETNEELANYCDDPDVRQKYLESVILLTSLEAPEKFKESTQLVFETQILPKLKKAWGIDSE